MLDQVKEIHHFSQDDLMTEDIFVLDCHSDVFVWVGQGVDPKVKSQTIDIGEVIMEFNLCITIRCRAFPFDLVLTFSLYLHQKFIGLDFLMENLSRETPIFIVSEGCEPEFFTRFFNWDSKKSMVSR
jgi:gelsolin